VRQGERVGLALAEDVRWVECFLALVNLGAVTVLCGDERSDRLVELCRLAECNTVIVSRDAAEITDSGLALLSIDELAQGSPERSIPLVEGAYEPRPVSPDDDVIIAFTSGTNGTPKGAILTHRGVITGLWNMILGAAVAAEQDKAPRRRKPQAPCTMVLSPLSHVGGYCQLLLMLALGGKVVISPTWNSEATFATIAREKVTAVVGATASNVRDLLDHLPCYADLSSLAALHFTGIDLRAGLRDELVQALPYVRVGIGYGLTETNGTICSMASMELRCRSHCCGRLLPSVDCMIADRDGRPLPAGQIGVIWLRGAMMMRAYCGGAAAVQPDGWFDTGDIGYLSEDDHLYVLGRADGVVTTSHGVVLCEDIERLLGRNPALDEVVALRAGDGRVGGKLHVVITPRSGTEPDLAELQAEIATFFHGIRPTISVRFAIPQTRTGKPDRARLRRELGLPTPG
jgi:long-chain acyl-CoA synthetase